MLLTKRKVNEAETMAKMIDAKIKVYCWDVRDGSSILRWYKIADVNDNVKKGLIDAVSDTVNDAVSDTVNDAVSDAVKSILNLKEGAGIKDIMVETVLTLKGQPNTF